jgi:hypothetical protein
MIISLGVGMDVPMTEGMANGSTIKAILIILRLVKIFCFCFPFSALPARNNIIFKKMAINALKYSGQM